MTRYTSPLTALVLALSVTTASAQTPLLHEAAIAHGPQFATVPASLVTPVPPPTLTRQALDRAAAMTATQTKQPAADGARLTGKPPAGVLLLAGLLGATLGMVPGGFAGYTLDLASCESAGSGECLPIIGGMVGLTVGSGVGAALGVHLAKR